MPTKTHVLNLLHRLVDGAADQPAGRDPARSSWPCARNRRRMFARYDGLATAPGHGRHTPCVMIPPAAAIVIMLRKP